MERKSKSLGRLNNLDRERDLKNGYHRTCRECGCAWRLPPPGPKRSRSAVRDVKHTSIKNITRSDDVIGKSSKTTSSLSRTQSEGMLNQTIVSTEIKTEPGQYAPKRYITKCYFQPKQDPVSYSETVILTLGSKKKHYFETVMYQTKLIPFRWTESMTTITPAAVGNVFQTQHKATVQEPKFHYMSLEPQQNAAIEKIRTAGEIAV